MTTPNSQARALELVADFDADRNPDAGPYVTEVVDALRAALDREKAALAEVPKWLTIESTPKDGSEILLKRETRVSSGAWIAEIENMASEYHANGTYLGQYGTGEVTDAFWGSWDGGFLAEEPPTHWMPLPTPPQSHQQVGEVAVSFTVGRIVGDAQGGGE